MVVELTNAVTAVLPGLAVRAVAVVPHHRAVLAQQEQQTLAAAAVVAALPQRLQDKLAQMVVQELSLSGGLPPTRQSRLGQG